MKKGSSFKYPSRKLSMRSDDLVHPTSYAMSAANPIRYAQPQGTMYRSTLSEEIKEIERRIRRCERKIRQERQKSL